MFIYVTDETTRDALLRDGYVLYERQPENKKMWLFYNKKNRDLVFANQDAINFAVSDVLLF